MGRLMKYLKDYKKESILAPLFKLLEAFFELMVPLVMANIIDRGIANEDMGTSERWDCIFLHWQLWDLSVPLQRSFLRQRRR